MELIHILPKGNLSSKPEQKYELYLADEVLKDPEFYERYVKDTPGYKILDNSLNELGSALSLERLNEAASIIHPNEFVYPDSVDCKRSEELLYESIMRADEFAELRELKRMAVVHANSWIEAFQRSDLYMQLPEVDVLAYSKVEAERWSSVAYKYDGRTSLVYALCHLREAADNVSFHFLGFSGFEEFSGYEDVSTMVRSTDSRFFIEAEPGGLWKHREQMLSHVSLGSERVIEDLEYKMKRVREEYESYGLS